MNGINYLINLKKKDAIFIRDFKKYNIYDTLFLLSEDFCKKKFNNLVFNDSNFFENLFGIDYEEILTVHSCKYIPIILKNIMIAINSLNLNIRFETYDELLKNTNFTELIYKYAWNSEDYSETFIGLLIDSLDINNIDIELTNYLIKVFEKLYYLDKTKFHIWFKNLLEKHKDYSKTNIIVNNNLINHKVLTFLNKISLVFLQLFNHKFNGEYKIIDNGIFNIDLENKNLQNLSFSNILYIFIIKFCEISIIPTILKINYTKSQLLNLTDLYNIESDSVRWKTSIIGMKELFLKTMKKKIDTYTEQLKLYQNSVNRDFLSYFLNNFNIIFKTLNYFDNNAIKYPKNINSNIDIIYRYCIDIDFSINREQEIYESSINYCLKILKNKKFEYNLKSTVLYLLEKNFDILLIDSKELLNVLEDVYMLFEKNNDIEDYYKAELTDVINKIYFKLNSGNKIVLNTNTINILLTFSSSCFDDLILTISNINIYNNYNIYSNNNTTIFNNEEKRYYDIIQLNKLVLKFNQCINLIRNLLDNNSSSFIDDINCGKLVSLINHWLIQLDKKIEIKNFDFKKYLTTTDYFSWKFVSDFLYLVYLKYYKNENFIKNIRTDVTQHEDYLNILEKMLSKNNDIYIYIYDKLRNSVNNFSIKDIPLEFCDPILYTPIENPIILPESKVIIDKNTIINYLIHDSIDPFNRTPLTIEQVEEYNNKEEIIFKIKDFVKKFNNWKKTNSS
uniref:U-box domain-containing protein n=1 Tax=viral metagenome TaxID=1070528 RepID=A0A6C0IZY9_9ZZZZ